MPTQTTTAQSPQYEQMSTEQLDQELISISKMPNARTNVEALTKVSAIMAEYKKRGIDLPTQRAKKAANTSKQYVSVVIGILLVAGGIVLTSNSTRIFYGAIIVGAIMIIKGLIGSNSNSDY